MSSEEEAEGELTLTLPKPLSDLVIDFLYAANSYAQALNRHALLMDMANRGTAMGSDDVYGSAQERRMLERILKSSLDSIVGHYCDHE